MVGTQAEGGNWLRRALARPKLSLSFALLIFVLMFVAAKVAVPRDPATATIELVPNALEDQIAALDGNLLSEPATVGREMDRLRSEEMARAVLDRLPGETAAVLAEDVSLAPVWLWSGLEGACARDDVVGVIVRPVCGVLSPDASQMSLTLRGMREALSLNGDPQAGRISISFSMDDPARAATMANLYATTYVEQRVEDKERLQREVELAVVLARMIHAPRPGDDPQAPPQATGDAAQAPGGAAAGPPEPPYLPDGDEETTTADHESFLEQTDALLSDPAWQEPPAIIVSAASPPARSILPTGGFAVALGGLVSIVLGVAFGTLVNAVWPAAGSRRSFYENPYWPQSGDAVPPQRRRVAMRADVGRQLIPTDGPTGRSDRQG